MPKYSTSAIQAWYFKTIKQRSFCSCMYLFWSDNESQDILQERTKQVSEEIHPLSAAGVILFFLELFGKGKSSLMMAVLEQAWYSKPHFHQEKRHLSQGHNAFWCLWFSVNILRPTLSLQTFRTCLVSLQSFRMWTFGFAFPFHLLISCLMTFS